MRKLLILPPILLAALVFVFALQGRKAPQRVEAGEVARLARIVAAQSLNVVPRALAFGEVTPSRTWSAVAEVSARIAWINPEFKRGALLPENTELIRFDTVDYELALAQTEAQLSELDAREANARKSLEIEERTLGVLRRELARKQSLSRSGAAATSSVEQAERSVLDGEQKAQTLRSTLTLIPSQRRALETQAEGARRDLGRAVLRLPFAMRIGTVSVERGQWAQRGAVLAQGDGVEVAEISAQLPLDRLFPLIAKAEAPLGPGAAEAGRHLGEVLGLVPVVRLRTGERVLEWPARVARIAETVDAKTRTIGLIVTVDDPYGRAQPGVRPPLARGLFVEIELRGPTQPGRIAVPRTALHAGDVVHIADSDNRLRKRPLRLAYTQGDIAVVEEGLAAGERVVVSDLIPAVEGMLLDPTPDTRAAEAVAAAASGVGGVK
ncbi:MAG: efflux RND transporter periplasmic adaptor subunit [Alphaproteobacteria bacterium]|nr:efflux RND transporter periplasmic adaptor subunit [Alphaproteobacteria bacterium]